MQIESGVLTCINLAPSYEQVHTHRGGVEHLLQRVNTAAEKYGNGSACKFAKLILWRMDRPLLS